MAFSPDEIETGQGLPGAIVYEDVETVGAWLARRGKTRFSTATPDVQERSLILATETAEDAVRPRIRGRQRNYPNQGLLFPSVGAYDCTGKLLLYNEIPRTYLEGIRLLAEEAAAGRLLQFAGGPPIKTEETKNGLVTYQDGADTSSLYSNHPDAWQKIATVLPAGL